MFTTWQDLNSMNFVYEKIKKKRYTTCENQNIMAFDIETSNGFLQPDGKAYAFDHEKYKNTPEYYEDAQKVSLMYVWQFGVMFGDEVKVYSGRTWKEFDDFLEFLTKRILVASYGFKKYDDILFNSLRSKKKTHSLKMYIFIHNAGFEFQHLRNLYNREFSYNTGRRAAVFARTARKPMKFTIHKNRVTIEFRDSLVLVQKSLRAWSDDEDLTVKKLEEPKDYYLPIRTPDTPLTDEEIEYSCNDVASMCYGLKKYKDKYRTIGNIPLTQTGQVRRNAIANVALKNMTWAHHCADVTKSMSFDLYKDLRFMFCGGWTHANSHYTGRLLKDVTCFDFASSYPAVMTTRTYPLHPFEEVPKAYWDTILQQDLKDINLQYHYYVEFECDSIFTKTQNTWWSSSKCLSLSHPILDNGKIFAASSGRFLMTDLDYETFKKAYKYENMKIHRVMASKAGFLAKELILLILDYYGGKTSLKGVEGAESKYTESKQFVNSIYGCAVTRDVDDEVCFTADGWKKFDLTIQHFADVIGKKKDEQQFIFYQIGVWVTAWARHNLWDGIFALDHKIAYGDTDSIKGVFNEDDLKWFDEYNKEIEDLEKQVADKLGFDEALFRPKTPKGVEKRLGVFAFDGFCTEFKTLGAKRYADVEDDKIQVTIAGLPKRSGREKLNSLEGVRSFTSGLKFDTKESEKLTAHYNDNQPECIFVDRDGNEYKCTDQYGICLMPTTFDLSMTDEYIAFVDMIMSGRDSEYLNENCEPDILTF